LTGTIYQHQKSDNSRYCGKAKHFLYISKTTIPVDEIYPCTSPGFLYFFTGCTGLGLPHAKLPPVYNSTPTDISGPVSIVKPGYYRLAADIVPGEKELPGTPAPFCIRISASDVFLDGMGHTIDGIKITRIKKGSGDGSYSVASAAISLSGKSSTDWVSGITITNITIKNWNWGIIGSHWKNSEIRMVTLTNNSEGVSLRHTSGIVIRDSTLVQNNNLGVSGMDVENTTVVNNIINHSTYGGIDLNGKVQQVFYQNFFGRGITLPGIFFDQSETSGKVQVVLQNSVSDSRNGINIANSNADDIDSNTITNTSRGIILYNCGLDEHLDNNTFYRTDKNISIENPAMPLSILIGIILIFLFKLLTGTSNIAKKISSTRIINRILVRFGYYEDLIRSFVQKSRFSVVFEGPLAITFAGAVIFGGAYAFKSLNQLTLLSFCGLLFISGIVTVIPRAVQFFIAQKKGLPAEYCMWWGGTLVIIITMILPLGTIFGQPVKMEFPVGVSREKREVIIPRLAAPLSLIFLSLGFIILWLVRSPVTSLALSGIQMGLLSSVVLLLPMAPMDGEYIWRWNKGIRALFFFPVLIGYMYLIVMI